MKILALLIILWPVYISEQKSVFVVWNVGQGLWTTFIEEDRCLHFDMGGEKYPFAVQKYCYRKPNYIYISHWHKDHYSFIPRFAKNVFKACIAKAPPLFDPRIQKKISKIKPCKGHSSVTQVTNPFSEFRNIKDLNDTSLVFLYKNVLLPGDITKNVEKKISMKLRSLPIKTLLLAHHGSITSTTPHFLKHLPRASVSIASSRRAKYGHPHYKIKKRLKENSLSLLITEDWGPIYFRF